MYTQEEIEFISKHYYGADVKHVMLSAYIIEGVVYYSLREFLHVVRPVSKTLRVDPSRYNVTVITHNGEMYIDRDTAKFYFNTTTRASNLVIYHLDLVKAQLNA